MRQQAPVIWLNETPDSRYQVNQPRIKVQTIHSAKGLQYRVAILMWADLLPASFEDSDLEAERRLMFVALTRPTHLLALTYSHGSAFIDEIRDSNTTAGPPVPRPAPLSLADVETSFQNVPF